MPNKLINKIPHKNPKTQSTTQNILNIIKIKSNFNIVFQINSI